MELGKSLEHEELLSSWEALHGEKEVQGGPSCSLQLPDGGVQPAGGWPLLPGNKGKDKRKQPQVAPGEVLIGYQGKFLQGKGCAALAHSARGGGRIPMPGGI